MPWKVLSLCDSITSKHEAWCEKLNDNEVLEQLHPKLWPQGESGNKLLNIHEDIEGEDNEIGPGCYILDLGIQDIGCSLLWIRKEYIQLYKCCNEFLETHRKKQKTPQWSSQDNLALVSAHHTCRRDGTSEQTQDGNADEQLQLYKYLVNAEGMRHITGVVYESLAQSKFLKKTA